MTTTVRDPTGGMLFLNAERWQGISAAINLFLKEVGAHNPVSSKTCAIEL